MGQLLRPYALVCCCCCLLHDICAVGNNYFLYNNPVGQWEVCRMNVRRFSYCGSFLTTISMLPSSPAVASAATSGMPSTSLWPLQLNGTVVFVRGCFSNQTCVFVLLLQTTNSSHLHGLFMFRRRLLSNANLLSPDARLQQNLRRHCSCHLKWYASTFNHSTAYSQPIRFAVIFRRMERSCRF